MVDFTIPWVVLASFRCRDNQTRLTCGVKVPELRLVPGRGPEPKQRRKRSSSGLLSEGASTFPFGLPHSILLIEITMVLPLETN